MISQSEKTNEKETLKKINLADAVMKSFQSGRLEFDERLVSRRNFAAIVKVSSFFLSLSSFN